MIIYKATNLINGKCYIGKTIEHLNVRISKHIYSSNKPKTYFHKALKKYGIDGFKWEVLYECFNEKMLLKKEKHYIKKFNTQKNGYNLTNGGEGISGYKHSDDVKKICGLSMKGKKRSIESREKQSKTNKGKQFSIEYRRKLSVAQTGKKHSTKTKEKLRDIFSKCLWLITDPHGNKFEVRSLREYCIENNLSRENMSSVAHGRIKSSKGYKCEKIKSAP